METPLIPKPKQNEETISEQRHREIHKLATRLRGKYSGLIAATAVTRPGPEHQREKVTVVVDDLNSVVLNDTLYDVKLTATQLAYDAGLNIDIQAALASQIWKGIAERDEDALQTIRESLVIHDVGFLQPLQDALANGKIRPSNESVTNFIIKSEKSLKLSNEQVSKALLDLYWAVTDSAHAAVMAAGATPPSPSELAFTIDQTLVKRNLVHPRCVQIAADVFFMAKKIMHKEQFVFTGRQFDVFHEQADFFIKEMKEFVETYSRQP